MQRTILVADDNPINRKILRNVLCGEYEVLEACNGSETLEILNEAHQYLSAVLLDIVMPAMDGYEVLSHMQSSPELSQIPVIVTTGNTDEDAEMRALELGANDFITKPYNSRIIRHRLKNTINLRERASIINALQKDSLTGLYNRGAFFEKAAEMIASKEPGYYVLSCIDIDNFKVINDQYGSEKGDEVLRNVAGVYNRGLSALGGICCRIAADNFAALYPRDALLTGKLDELRGAACALNGLSQPVKISSGRYIVEDKGLSVSAMYDRATIAKVTIKGRFDAHTAQYDESMRESILREQEIVNDMNGALNSGQFEVWFQPQYNHLSGALIGAEALARWRHPQKGLISPGEFIPVFERNGFIYELDKFVWERSCAFLRKWIDEGRSPVPLSVNISRYDVFRHDMVDIISGLLKKYDIPVSMLRLEITESAFAKSTWQIMHVVKQLIDIGFTMEIDDFGSGYSSLNTLKDVPAQVLKLDMRFLENDENSERSGNILESIVRMAKWLGMSVIAEGVETVEQADYLKSIGCNYVQGYLYAKPMPASQFEALARSARKEEKLLVMETVEALDNNAFWNPKSMDTLIFNSYVGGACIFEYHNGHAEMLRATEKCARVIGGDALTIEDMFRLRWSDYMDEPDKRAVMEAIQKSMDTREEVVGECLLRDIPGCPRETYLRYALRVIAIAGSRALVYWANENVTARHEAEQNGRAAAEQLKIIMDNINGGVTATVMEGGVPRFLFSNDQFYTLLGYTRSEYDELVTNPHDLLYPEDRDRVVRDTVRASENLGSFTCDYRIVRRDGEIRWFRSNISVVRFPGIEAPVQLAVANDITTEKLAVRRSQRTEAQLQAIVNNVNGGISAATLVNGEIGYLYVNDEYYRMFGFTKENFEAELPRGLIDLIHPDDLPIINDSAAQVDKGGSATFTFRAYRRDGKLIWVRSNSSACSIEGVPHPVYVAVLRDVTKEKADEDSIRSMSENLQALMNDTPGGFCRIRVRPDGSLGTVYANQRLCDIRGMTSEQILSAERDDTTRMIHPDDVSIVLGAVKEMRTTGQTRTIRFRLRNGNGEYDWYLVFGRITRGEAGAVFINAYFADLSEQEKREVPVRAAMPLILSAIMQSSSDLSFTKDKDLRYVCCSPAFARFAGQESELGVIGKTDYDLFSREVADQFRADDIKLLKDGRSLVDYVERIPSSDGIPHYSRTSKFILRDTSGNIVGLYGVGRDITQDRTTFERLKLLTDSIPGGIATYACSPDGVKITYFNDGFCELLGCTRDEYELLSRQSVTSRVFDEDAPALIANLRLIASDMSPVDFTYRVRDGSGCKWINLRGAPGERSGDTVFVNTVHFDVTQRIQSEERLRVHEEEMKLAMAQMGKMVCEYDPVTRTLTMPDAYARQYDLPTVLTGVPGNPMRTQVIDPDYHQAYNAFYEAILRADPKGVFEYRARRAGGTWHWEREEFSTIFDSDGRPVKAVIAIEDTTEQRLRYELERSRPSLREENLIAHALFNLSTGQTLEYLYTDGSEVPLADRTALSYGDETIGWLLIEEEDRERCRALNERTSLLDRYARGEAELSLDYRRRMPDGDVIWVRNIIRMVRQPGGDDILMFVYYYNVEEEKSQELMYGRLVNENYDYVARVNGKSGRFSIIANTGVQYGMPPLRGDDFDAVAREIGENFIHPDDRDMTIQNTLMSGIKKNLADKDRFQFTCRVRRPDGTLRYKKITEYYLDRQRDIIIITREDVSSTVMEEMRKNELLADALSAANQANQAKTQFLSRMSHELRTPMNAIIGLAALSASEINNPRVMEDNITKIGMSARYLLSLINEVLEMSRIESGRMTLSESPFDFEHFISDINAIIYAQAAAKGVDYDVVVNSYLDPTYVGDATKLQEILVNVLGNAVKFTPPGGKITFAVEQIRCANKRATLRFIVSDTGVGIDAKFLPHLFEPFSQEVSGITSAAAGTGLGLAITKNLVEMMNGQISVQSIKNVGSVFTIDLQLGLSQNGEQYLRMASTMNLSRLSALVVDDDVVVCQSTEAILKAMGIKAEWVDNGHGAVERVREVHEQKRDFDTVFIDWKMPDMDGIETTRQIRKIVGPEVTIIIMTAYDWRAIEPQAREAGVDMFMEKPLFHSSIVKAFEKVFMANKDKIEPQPAAQPDFTGKRVLLAEDHPLNVEVARRILEKTGAQVVVVNNGLEAMETFTIAEEGYFDAILMDIRMPVMDGLAATKNIRSLRKKGSQSIPIIAMTANAFDEDIEKSLNSGMDAHLTKPIDPQVLFATLQRMFDR